MNRREAYEALRAAERGEGSAIIKVTGPGSLSDPATADPEPVTDMKQRWLVNRERFMRTPPPDIQERIGEATDAIHNAFRTGMTEDSVDSLVKAWELLDGIASDLPRVEVWCVIKHYANHDRVTGQWKPATWLGCTTQAQAESLAPAIDEHYRTSNPHWGPNFDTFTAERAHIAVSMVVHPDLTVEEYLAYLP